MKDDSGHITLDFAKCTPEKEALCELGELLKTGEKLLWEDNFVSWLSYGPGFAESGFKKALSKFLSEQYNECVCQETIGTSHGVRQAIQFITSLLFEKRKIAFIEEVTDSNGDVFGALGFSLVSVPIKNNGIDLEAFKQLLEEHCKPNEVSDAYTAVAYLMPGLHVPLGMSYSKDCCTEIIRLARQFNVLVLCNDEYNILRFNTSSQVPRRLFSYDNKNDTDYGRGHVISLGSFSNMLFPSLDFGWIEAPVAITNLIAQSGEVGSGSSFGYYYQGLLKCMLKNDLILPYLSKTRIILQKRTQELRQRLVDKLPTECKVSQPEGGPFLWLDIPNIDTDVLLQVCIKKHQLVFTPGHLLSPTGKHRNCLQLSVSNLDSNRLVLAADKLAEEVQVMLKE